MAISDANRTIIFYDSETSLFLYQQDDKYFVGSTSGGITSMSICSDYHALTEFQFSFAIDNKLEQTVIKDALDTIKVFMMNFKEHCIDKKQT